VSDLLGKMNDAKKITQRKSLKLIINIKMFEFPPKNLKIASEISLILLVDKIATYKKS
jgi:hypothetical protein